MATAILRVYQTQFDAHPGATLAATNGALSAVADVVAQSAQMIFTTPPSETPKKPEFDPPRPQRYDLQRTLRFAAFGAGMGPIIGRWNLFLEKNFPLRVLGSAARSSNGTPKVSMTALGKRVLADQSIMAPIGLVIFIGSMGKMEGRDNTAIKQKYNDMFLPAITANWKVWPAIQLINFRFMPLAYRVPFQASCGVFWTLYLSLLNAREDIRQDGPIEAKKDQLDEKTLKRLT
ncbi:hypothetical protein DL93DRAFT_2073950 [Clavulina sp. PMI_390]|nr:hypothetical protein DL93DRAFT_2073950 [Clavulina sp. PMI_390]